MDNIEMLVEKITDIVIQRLEEEEPKNTVGFLGKEYLSIRTYYEKRDYKIISVEDEFDMDILIVTELSVINMNRIALGIPQIEDEIIIFEHLLNGKDVIILEEGIEPHIDQDILPKALLQVVENYKKQLISYGVSILPLKTFEKINGTVSDRVKDKSYKSQKKELLTMAKVQRMNLQPDDIFDTNNIIVTALARDYMRDLGVQIL